jgi:tetratricopeptide (TPR) repeat protein
MLLGIFFLLLHACMPSKKTEIDGVLSHSDQYLSTGDYQKAIDTFRTAHAKYPEDKPLLRSYQKAVEEMKGSADRAFDRKEFVSSGRSYRLLLRNYQHFRDFAQQLSFDKKYLNARIIYCSEYLFKKGMEDYRSGGIKLAISKWEGLLSFDPDNAEAGKAYDTATTQLKNLQQK